MIGYIVQIGEEYVGYQSLLVMNINNAAIFSSEEDAIAVATNQSVDAKVVEHEHLPGHTTGGKVGTYFEYHMEIGS